MSIALITIFFLYTLHKNKCIRLETLQFATEFVQIWSLNLAFTCLLLSLILFFCENLLNYILVLIVWDTVRNIMIFLHFLRIVFLTQLLYCILRLCHEYKMSLTDKCEINISKEVRDVVPLRAPHINFHYK